MSRYIEHRMLEVGPLLVADSTLESGQRKCWIGAGGLEGRWVTHSEFRSIVAALVDFADALPPMAQPSNEHSASGSPARQESRPDDTQPAGSLPALQSKEKQ